MRVGLIGAGQMGTDVVATTTMMQGIRVVVIADIDIQRARDSYRIGLVEGEVVVVGTAAEADAAVEAGRRVAVRLPRRHRHAQHRCDAGGDGCPGGRARRGPALRRATASNWR